MKIKLDEHLWNKLLKIRDIKRRRQVLTKIGYNPDEIAQILADLRIQSRAKLKFPRASQMQFTKEGLKQASSKWLAEYRTLKMKQNLSTIKNVLEIGSGIGGDTIAQGLRWNVITIEKDLPLLQVLKHNLEVYHLLDKIEIIEADILEIIHQTWFREKLAHVDAIIFDPSRKSNSSAASEVEEYEPSLSLIPDLLQISPNVVVKLASAIDISSAKFDCDVEVVSYKGSVKETMLWFGKFKLSDQKNVIATKLPEKISLVKQASVGIPAISLPKKYLFEPDPAFIKAQVLNDIASEYNLTLLNENIAYLTGDTKVITPVMKCYQYISHCDLNFEKINRLLKQYQIGQLDYKSRGVKIDLKTVHKSIEYHGKGQGILIFTLISKKPSIILCKYCILKEKG